MSDHPYAETGAELWRMRTEAGLSTQKEAADLLGISLRAYSDYERGIRQPPEHKWIVMKERLASYTGDDAPSASRPEQDTPHRSNVKSLTNRGNPVYDLEASAGDGAVISAESIVGYLPSRISGAFWFTAVGDSMTPTICPNSACQALPFRGNLEDIRTDGIYIFRLEGGLHIKRLQLLPQRRVRVVSDNPLYQPYEVAVDDGLDFEILGRVVM